MTKIIHRLAMTREFQEKQAAIEASKNAFMEKAASWCERCKSLLYEFNSYYRERYYLKNLLGSIAAISNRKGKAFDAAFYLEEISLLQDNLKCDSTHIYYDFTSGSYDSLSTSSSQDSRANQLKKEINELETELDAICYQLQLQDEILQNLSKCDQIRASLDPYDVNILRDPNRGHWELWDWNQEEPQEGTGIEFEEGLVARNPADDINSGIVAIDFGTRSTVVVYRNEYSDIMPLQVGNGSYREGVRAENYENPTIIHFIDLEGFMAKYRAREGRPFTSWEQITVSHSAWRSLNSNQDSRNYGSFFSDLKQWCGTEGARVKLKDSKQTYDLPSYLDLLDDDIDPIEIYAYYLGLYINNMLQEKHIFMHYLLSFPVKYERNIREKMLRSFRRGLKKSLPTALLSNEEAMKRFKVEEGVTEPAAYASTALLEYGFEPEGDAKCYYGVFDFGGGTTDFDFGVLTELDDGRNDYLLTHFGENGDRTLGGENLLRLLAYHILVENYDLLIRYDNGTQDGDKLSFPMVADGWEFPGHEGIIRSSQEAWQNMHNLMEKLRKVWEEPSSEEAQRIVESRRIEVDLFGESRQMYPNVSLAFDDLDLSELIQERIEKGVRNFFFSLKQAFAGLDDADLEDIGELSIFLAGNSSKAEVVQRVFEEYAHEGKAAEMLGMELPEFRIYPPLGTPEADEILAVLHQEEPQDDLQRPTGKTGVAYGLLHSYGNSAIKVRNLLPKGTQETQFQFYVGKARKKRFNVVLDRGADYDTWVKFIDAGGDFDLLYTEVPEAATNASPVNIAKRFHVVLEKPEPDKFVFIKPAGSRSICYFIAADEAECSSPEDGREPSLIELQ